MRYLLASILFSIITLTANAQEWRHQHHYGTKVNVGWPQNMAVVGRLSSDQNGYSVFSPLGGRLTAGRQYRLALPAYGVSLQTYLDKEVRVRGYLGHMGTQQVIVVEQLEVLERREFPRR